MWRARDVLGQVTAALEFGEHPEHGQEVLGDLGVRGPVEQTGLHGRLESLVEVVDVGISCYEVAGRFPVHADKGMGGARDSVLHEGEELDYVTVDELELGRVIGLEPQQGAPCRMKVTCVHHGANRGRVIFVAIRVALAPGILAGNKTLSHGGTVPLFTSRNARFGVFLPPHEAFILTRCSLHIKFAFC